MNLNLGKILYTSENSNTFHNEYKDNIKIAEAYKYLLKPYIIQKPKIVKKSFYPTRVVFKQGILIVADEAGYISTLTDTSIADVLYEHKSRVNCLILSKNKEYMFSAGEDQIIKIYKFLPECKFNALLFKSTQSLYSKKEFEIETENNEIENKNEEEEQQENDEIKIRASKEDEDEKNIFKFSQNTEGEESIKEEKKLEYPVSFKSNMFYDEGMKNNLKNKIAKSLNKIYNSKVQKGEDPFQIEEETEELYELLDQKENILSLCYDDEDHRLYSSSPSGKIYVWDLKIKKLKTILNLEKVPIISLVIHDNKLLAGTSNNKILIINTQTMKLNTSVATLSPGINTMVSDEIRERIYAGTNTGLIEILNSENFKKIGEINIGQSSIDSMCFLNDDLLMVLNNQGIVGELNLNNQEISHLRKEKVKGNQYFALNENNQIYVVGHGDKIQKWDLNTRKLIRNIYRNETPSRYKYNFYFYDIINNVYILYSEKGNCISYSIKNTFEKSHIMNRTYIPFDLDIKNMIISIEKHIVILIYEDLDLRIWDSQQMKFIGELKGHRTIPIYFYFSNDQKLLYSVEKDSSIFVWDIDNKKLKKEIKAVYNEEVKGILMTNNESFLYIIRKKGILQTLDLNSHKIIFEKIINDEDITTIYYDKNLHTLFTADVGGMIVKTVIEGPKKITSNELINKDLIITTMSLDRTGKKMAFATEKRKVYIFDLEKNYGFGSIGKMRFDVKQVFFSEDSEVLYCNGESGVVYGWNLEYKTEIKTFESIEKVSISALAFNQTKIFSATKDELQVWDLVEKNIEHTITINDGYSFAYCLGINLSDNLLYSGHLDGKVFVWSLENYEKLDEIVFHTSAIAHMEVSQSDKLIVTYSPDRVIVVYEIASNVNTKFIPEFDTKSLKISDNDMYILCETINGQVCIYDTEGAILAVLGKRSNFLRGYDISIDNNYIFLIYKDSSVQIWDIKKSEFINNFPRLNYSINYGVRSKNGNKLFLLGNREELNIINSKTGKTIKSVKLRGVAKIKLLQKFNDDMIFVNENKIIHVKDDLKLSFYEKEYIFHSFLGYDHNNAEKEFFSNLEYLKDRLNSNYMLVTYFHPILVCALFNYQNAIQFIFKKNYASYPILNDENQISPLLVALKLGHYNISQIILQELSKNPENVFFSKREMIELLNFKYKFTHNYLLFFMIKIQKFTNTSVDLPLLSKLDQDMRIEYDYKPNFTPEKYEGLSLPSELYKSYSKENKAKKILNIINSNIPTHKNENKSLSSKFSGFTKSETASNMLTSEKQKKNKEKPAKKIRTIWRPTYFFRINGYYSFDEGSILSTQFLNNYSKSQSNEFILSNWRQIIDYKWNKIYWMLVPQAILNWSHTVFYTLFLLYPDKLFFLIIEAALLLAISLYEMISLSITGFGDFFKNFYNIIDSLMILICIAMMICTYLFDNDENELLAVLKYFQVFSLVIVYYRGLTYLRIFKIFRNLIDMVISVTLTSVSLLLLIGMFLIFFAVMYTKASYNTKLFGEFLRITFNTINGELEDFDTLNLHFKGKEDDFDVLGWIIFVFNAVFVPVILVNFLIAKMSNKYTELEEIEGVTAYREKAKLLAEIEYFYKIFKFKKKSHFSKKEGFTFIAVDASNNQENIKNQEKEDNFSLEEFKLKLTDIHTLFKNEISNNNEVRNNLNNLQSNVDFVKEQIEQFKMENISANNQLEARINNLETTVKDLFKNNKQFL